MIPADHPKAADATARRGPGSTARRFPTLTDRRQEIHHRLPMIKRGTDNPALISVSRVIALAGHRKAVATRRLKATDDQPVKLEAQLEKAPSLFDRIQALERAGIFKGAPRRSQGWSPCAPTPPTSWRTPGGSCSRAGCSSASPWRLMHSHKQMIHMEF